MITESSLQERTSRDLAQMAKQSGVRGWHSMRKPQLVKALFKLAKNKEKQKSAKPKSKANSSVSAECDSEPLASAKTRPKKRKPQQVESTIARKLRRQRQQQEKLRDISFTEIGKAGVDPPKNDRIVLIVRDAFWLQGYWEITAATVNRVKIAMGNYWHKSVPVLRLIEIGSRGNANACEQVVEEIEIQGGASNWFIKVPQPKKSYCLAIGYKLPSKTTETDRFHLISKSNEVLTAPNNSTENTYAWSDINITPEKYYAQSGGYDIARGSTELKDVFEEKSSQPLHSVAIQNIPTLSRFGADLEFHVDAHLIVHGFTDRNACLTIAGSPVTVKEDGSFVLKMDLPDKRQVLPVVASSFDGTQKRTTILAIERNTKELEPIRLGVNEVEF